jgi:hypothetical protein
MAVCWVKMALEVWFVPHLNGTPGPLHLAVTGLKALVHRKAAAEP